jgi:hypothetical protein
VQGTTLSAAARLPPADVLARLGSVPDGLSASEAARRLHAFGPTLGAGAGAAQRRAFRLAMERGRVALAARPGDPSDPGLKTLAWVTPAT